MNSGGRDGRFIFKVEWIIVDPLDRMKRENNSSFPVF